MNMGEYDRAIADYDAASRLNPNDAYPLANRGTANLHKDEFELAIAEFGQAISLEPNDHYAYFGRGVAYFYLENYDLAIAHFDQAMRLSPIYVYAYLWRGYAYYRKGSTDKAFIDNEQALRVSRGGAEAFEQRGLLYFYLGQFDKAVEDFQQSLNAVDGESYVAIWLYLAKARSGHPNAVEVLRPGTLRQEFDDWADPIVRMYLGELDSHTVLEMAGAGNSREDINRHVKTYFFVGQRELMDGNKSQARTLFEKAVRAGFSSYWGLFEYEGARVELQRLGN